MICGSAIFAFRSGWREMKVRNAACGDFLPAAPLAADEPKLEEILDYGRLFRLSIAEAKAFRKISTRLVFNVL